ncbi:MAG: regulatory protein RecX [Clostridia bacterium]|nr:regulatory protein RecX [Clostridia bacterium]MBR2972720.1 regulatory protein RecX [Clostridia bacterium]
MIITNLKFNKKGTFDIYVDDVYICDIDDETVYKMSIKKGDEVSEEFLSEIKNISQVQGAKRAGARMLSASMKSRYDFEIKLVQKGFDKGAVKQAADFFEEKGFLNDAAYAKAFVADALTLKKQGAAKIRMTLKSKGISGDIIDALLADADEAEEENLKTIVEKEMARMPVRDKKHVDKLKRKLYSRGYEIGDITSAINEAGGENFEK